MSNETADILDRAADALWMYGRCTQELTRDDGSMCVIGAICHAIDIEPEWSVIDALLPDELLAPLAATLPPPDYLSNTFTRAQHTVYSWNDRLPPSPENDAEVVDTIRRCAKDLRNNTEDES